MIETILDYEDFVERIDKDKPVHFKIVRRIKDYRSIVQIFLELSAVDKKEQWILRLIVEEVIEAEKGEKIEDFYKRAKEKEEELLEKYATPLKATEGFYE